MTTPLVQTVDASWAGGPLLGLSLSAADVRQAVVSVICLVLAVSVHECAHALVAHRLGDPTPRSQGRLTLNPVAHADPIGTLVLPIVMSLSASGMMFGWGRPVETHPRFYNRKVSMRGGMALVALAGPLSNVLLAVLTLGLVWGLGQAGVLSDVRPGHPLHVFFSLNVLLFAFNLLPLHPLDGGKVLGWLLGVRRQHVDEFLQRYGGMILLVLVIALPQVLQFVLGPFFLLGELAFKAVL